MSPLKLAEAHLREKQTSQKGLRFASREPEGTEGVAFALNQEDQRRHVSKRAKTLLSPRVNPTRDPNRSARVALAESHANQGAEARKQLENDAKKAARKQKRRLREQEVLQKKETEKKMRAARRRAKAELTERVAEEKALAKKAAKRQKTKHKKELVITQTELAGANQAIVRATNLTNSLSDQLVTTAKENARSHKQVEELSRRPTWKGLGTLAVGVFALGTILGSLGHGMVDNTKYQDRGGAPIAAPTATLVMPNSTPFEVDPILSTPSLAATPINSPKLQGEVTLQVTQVIQPIIIKPSPTALPTLGPTPTPNVEVVPPVNAMRENGYPFGGTTIADAVDYVGNVLMRTAPAHQKILKEYFGITHPANVRPIQDLTPENAAAQQDATQMFVNLSPASELPAMIDEAATRLKDSVNGSSDKTFYNWRADILDALRQQGTNIRFTGSGQAEQIEVEMGAVVRDSVFTYDLDAIKNAGKLYKYPASYKNIGQNEATVMRIGREMHGTFSLNNRVGLAVGVTMKDGKIDPKSLKVGVLDFDQGTRSDMPGWGCTNWWGMGANLGGK